MAILDAQGTVFTFNGVEVKGIVRYNIVDGVTPDVPHNAISKAEREYLPGVPEFGNITVFLMRDFLDPGQIEMENARSTSIRRISTLRFSDGTGIQFLSYVKKLPIVGTSNGLGEADAMIKIAGKITAA